jgi:hypothetical protein
METTTTKQKVVFTKAYCQELSGKSGASHNPLIHQNSVPQEFVGGKTDPNTEILESAEARVGIGCQNSVMTMKLCLILQAIQHLSETIKSPGFHLGC